MAISTQYQNLNLIPGKSAPVVVHCSQGNVGDTVGFYLYDGDEPFYPTNVSIAVHGVRADGSVFGPYTVAVTSGSNLVTFELVTAMTSVAGAAIGELVISDSGQNQVGSANFGILVETTPYSSTVTYEDDLSIYQRILAYVQSIPAELSGQIAAETDRATDAEAAIDARIDTINSDISRIDQASSSASQAISAETTRATNAEATINARINQIIAPSGEAPSAAEVADARIGADGVTYSSLGTAIRTQIDNLNNAMGDYSSRNLITKFYGTSETINGITFDFNETDHSVHVYGTATANATKQITNAAVMDLPDSGDYVLSGTPNGGAADSYFLAFYYTGNTSANIATCYSGGVAFNYSQNKSWNIYIRVVSGKTVDITFYPFLRKSSVVDYDYVPGFENVKQYIDYSSEQVYKSCTRAYRKKIDSDIFNCDFILDLDFRRGAPNPGNGYMYEDRGQYLYTSEKFFADDDYQCLLYTQYKDGTKRMIYCVFDYGTDGNYTGWSDFISDKTYNLTKGHYYRVTFGVSPSYWGDWIEEHYKMFFAVGSGFRGGFNRYVSKSGNSLYSTVMGAVVDSWSGDTIYVAKGRYQNEVINAIGKDLSIIGEDRYYTIIENNFGDYQRPPVSMCTGVLKNLTVCVYNDGTENPNGWPYCVHVESETMVGKTFLVQDCNFYGELRPPFGVGIRKDAKLVIDNCKIESNQLCIFAHPPIGEEGAGVIEVHDSELLTTREDGNAVLGWQRMGSSANSLTMQFVNNLIGVRGNKSIGEIFEYSGDSAETLFISQLSYGNSAQAFNP